MDINDKNCQNKTVSKMCIVAVSTSPFRHFRFFIFFIYQSRNYAYILIFTQSRTLKRPFTNHAQSSIHAITLFFHFHAVTQQKEPLTQSRTLTHFLYKQWSFSGQAQVLLKNLENAGSFLAQVLLIFVHCKHKTDIFGRFQPFSCLSAWGCCLAVAKFSRISAQCCS